MQIEKLEKMGTCLLVQQLLLRTVINIKKLKLLKKKMILRRWWVKPHLYPNVRNVAGAYELVFNHFKVRNCEEFYEFALGERLQKQICRRPPIPPEIRFAIILHYLGHGGSVSSEAMYFRVGKSTMYDIIAGTFIYRASVFAATDFSRKCLTNTNIRMPLILVGNEIFPLGHYLMKPFSRRCINSVTQRIFNYRLSRARFTIECAFGILCLKWRVLNRALNFKLETINNIIAACKEEEDDDYAQQIRGLPKDVPAMIRNRFAEYFVSDVRSIPWQYQYV
ncbi:hypothetical protein TSAR_005894 [Trichomalopsis sarcophagae]|uniref:DDE Tnp4 domain-containing protein n=1 Tax=Trichomalopsis sarcophagae TaxID=543379 RepID=A0A232FLJ3_9HYME|nr:hypothetical protein TSAR_005894 [Trichomalopsis sarcophagae]